MKSSEAAREFATDVVRQLRAAGYIALWAGGCVRDLLLGREVSDFDVATNATPDQVRQLFGKKRTLAVGQSFGVIIVLATDRDAGQVEIATFRSEGNYLDGRRPSVVTYSTPELDAQRRDFTINGMFYDPVSEQIHDYVGGRDDLARRSLRAIGDPHERMAEDKLRMLRAVRFTATLAFEIDAATRDAVRQMAPELTVVSAERIAQELRKILAHRNRVRGVELLRELGLLRVIFPEVVPESLEAFAAQHAQSATILGTLRELPEAASFEQAMAAILQELPSPPSEPRTHTETIGTVWAVTRRLKLSADEMVAIAWLVGHQESWADAPTQSQAQLKRLLAHPLSADLRGLVRARARAMGTSPAAIDFVDQFVQQHSPEEIQPPELISGKDLIERGLSPGPRFKSLLDQIRDSQLNGEIVTREAALQRLSDLI